MSKRILVAACLVASICAPLAVAQDAPLVRVITTHVQLGHQQHYESVIPKLWVALKQVGGASPVFVSAGMSDPGSYNFIVPMTSFAEIDSQNELLQKAFAAAPAVASELQGITTSIDDEVWRNRPDLGYVPKTPRLQDAEQAFTYLVFLYPHPGQVPAFEAVLKEAAALRAKHGLADGTGVGQLLIGPDGPAYVVLTGAKDEVDYHVEAAKGVQKMGAEWQALLAKGGPMVRRVEYASAAARPALAYQP